MANPQGNSRKATLQYSATLVNYSRTVILLRSRNPKDATLQRSICQHVPQAVRNGPTAKFHPPSKTFHEAGRASAAPPVHEGALGLTLIESHARHGVESMPRHLGHPLYFPAPHAKHMLSMCSTSNFGFLAFIAAL